MYNSNFYHDAQLTCTQATDLILKNWRPNDDAEHLRNVLQDLLDLKDYFSRMELDAEEAEVKQQAQPAAQAPALDLVREAEALAATDERIRRVEASLRS